VRDATGTLDGDADGAGGDAFRATFTVPQAAATLAIPDLVRAPGQAAGDDGAGLPVTLTSAGDIERLVFTLRYDPATLAVSGIAPDAALPAGTELVADVSTPGLARFVLLASQPLPAGSVALGRIVASVPQGAPYGAARRLDLAIVAEPFTDYGGVAADDAVQLVARPGDANLSGGYDGVDLVRMLRVADGFDFGFAATPTLDPALVGDFDGDGRVTRRDVARLQAALQSGTLTPARFAGAGEVLGLSATTGGAAAAIALRGAATGATTTAIALREASTESVAPAYEAVLVDFASASIVTTGYLSLEPAEGARIAQKARGYAADVSRWPLLDGGSGGTTPRDGLSAADGTPVRDGGALRLRLQARSAESTLPAAGPAWHRGFLAVEPASVSSVMAPLRVRADASA
jgi:hypothetical protein